MPLIGSMLRAGPHAARISLSNRCA
jgi:hypothetical protein